MAITREGETLGLQDYVQVVRRRKWVVVLFAIVAVGASIAFSESETPTYTGTAKLLLTPLLSSSLIQATNPNESTSTATVDVPTDTQVIESTNVQNHVAKSILNPPKVSVSQVGTTDVVNVSTSSHNRRIAADAANAYAQAYIQVQQYQSNVALNNAAKLVQGHIQSISSQIASLDQQISAANGASTIAALEAQLPSLETQQSTYQTQAAQYEFFQSLNTGGGQIISAAKVPSSPSSPKTTQYAIIALIVGVLLGLAGALLLEYFDDRIRTRSDLQTVLGDLPMLASIPDVEGWRNQTRPMLITSAEPHSASAEAYRNLRTSIQFANLDGEARLMQFTSPVSSDGKTTTLANTAVTMAEAGLRVLVVDCDLRRPRIHDFFDLKNDVGFTSVLLGQADLVDAVQDVKQAPGVHLLASGPKPPNPSELLSSAKARDLFGSMRDLADIVLIDSPPILPVTDPMLLARFVDSIILVMSLGTTTRFGATASLERLVALDAPLTGVVVNRVSDSEPYYYHYHYRYTESRR